MDMDMDMAWGTSPTRLYALTTDSAHTPRTRSRRGVAQLSHARTIAPATVPPAT